MIYRIIIKHKGWGLSFNSDLLPVRGRSKIIKWIEKELGFLPEILIKSAKQYYENKKN